MIVIHGMELHIQQVEHINVYILLGNLALTINNTQMVKYITTWIMGGFLVHIPTMVGTILCLRMYQMQL